VFILLSMLIRKRVSEYFQIFAKSIARTKAIYRKIKKEYANHNRIYIHLNRKLKLSCHYLQSYLNSKSLRTKLFTENHQSVSPCSHVCCKNKTLCLSTWKRFENYIEGTNICIVRDYKIVFRGIMFLSALSNRNAEKLASKLFFRVRRNYYK